MNRTQSDLKVYSQLKNENKLSFKVLMISFITFNNIIIYIYHALINTLSTHMIYINLNIIFYTHVEHSPTKTIYIKYYTHKKN